MKKVSISKMSRTPPDIIDRWFVTFTDRVFASLLEQEELRRLERRIEYEKQKRQLEAELKALNS